MFVFQHRNLDKRIDEYNLIIERKKIILLESYGNKEEIYSKINLFCELNDKELIKFVTFNKCYLRFQIISKNYYHNHHNFEISFNGDLEHIFFNIYGTWKGTDYTDFNEIKNQETLLKIITKKIIWS